MSQSSGFSALICEACAFEPVLFGGGSAVVGGATVGQHRGDASAAGVPGPRTSFQNYAVPFPAKTIFAGGVGCVHAILLPRLIEEVAADPGPPSLARTLHQRIFDAGEAVAREDGAGALRGETFRLVGLDCLDPPVGAARVCAADVQTPAPRLGTDERRALHALRAELGLLESSDGGEPFAVLRARDHGLSDAIVALAEAVADDERAVLVERSTRRTGPVAGSVSRGSYSDDGSCGPRQRKIAQRVWRSGGVRGLVSCHSGLLSSRGVWMRSRKVSARP